MTLDSNFSIELYKNPISNYKNCNTLESISSEEDYNILAFYNKEQNLIEKCLSKNDNEIQENKIEHMNKLLEMNKNYLLQKRGRRKTNFSKKKKTHIGIDFDNMQRKIQVHFFNFIVSISNDALHTICKNSKKYFKNIDHNVKRIINVKYFQMLKSCSIKKIIQMDVSSRYTIFSKEHNKNILTKICNSSSWLNNFFNMNYLELFNYYYNRGEPINKIVFENKEIIFSKRTKCFHALLNKNKEQEKYLIQTAKMAYFNGFDTISPNNLFVIIKNEN